MITILLYVLLSIQFAIYVFKKKPTKRILLLAGCFGVGKAHRADVIFTEHKFGNYEPISNETRLLYLLQHLSNFVDTMHTQLKKKDTIVVDGSFINHILDALLANFKANDNLFEDVVIKYTFKNVIDFLEKVCNAKIDVTYVLSGDVSITVSHAIKNGYEVDEEFIRNQNLICSALANITNIGRVIYVPGVITEKLWNDLIIQNQN